MWKKFCDDHGVDVKSLKWIIHKVILNRSCEAVAKQTIGQPVDEWVVWPPYPGHVYPLPEQTDEPPTEEEQTAIDNFNALVGCPNGYGIAFMLQQRMDNAFLGRMVINEVDLFGTDGSMGYICMAYGIGPKKA